MINSGGVSAEVQKAFQVLRSGDAATSRSMLEALLREQPGDVMLLMGLAVSCQQLSDQSNSLAAVDKVLEQQPRYFPALLLKADILYSLGNYRPAASFYAAAIKVAPPDAQQTPATKEELERARNMVQQAASEFLGYLQDALKQEGFVGNGAAPRYEETLDLLCGKRQVYFQQPINFFFPGLPQKQFYERDEFDWIADLEAQTDPIAVEATNILKDVAAFKPYLHSGVNEPVLIQSQLLDNEDWSACYLINEGQVIDENAARCPQTMRALEKLPLSDASDKMPSVLFSLLRPKTRIEPHCGLFNTRLIGHLPLIVPDGCRLRVGNDTRSWKKGEVFIFDDSIEHDAANDSDELRVVLLFEIWRPELSETDRRFLRTIFSTLTDFPSGADALA